MNENVFKTTVAALTAAVAVYFNVLGLPLLALIVFMVVDYLTGMTGAYITGELSSKVGFRGIVKKLCYMCAVAVGVGTDYICSTVVENVGFSTDVCFFGLLVTVWLMLNEMLSILENLDEIGVPVPDFIRKYTEHLKQSVERRGENDEQSRDKK